MKFVCTLLCIVLLNLPSYCAEKEIIEFENQELIGPITTDLFYDSIFPFLSIDDSTPKKLITSLKELIICRNISKNWSEAIPADISKFMKENKIRVNVSDKNGNTALHFAAMEGNAELVKILLCAGANANFDAAYVFSLKRDKNNQENINKRFPFFKEINISNCLAKDVLSRVHDVRTDFLFNKIVITHITISKWLPLHDALYNNNIEVAQILCDYTDFCKNTNAFEPNIIHYRYEINEFSYTSVIAIYNMIKRKDVCKKIKQIHLLKFEISQILESLYRRGFSKVMGIIGSYLRDQADEF